MAFTYEYARPAITADCAVFGMDEDGLKVLLILRGSEPFRDQWALPGGFADVGEDLKDTAQRELAEETGLENISLKQLHTFSDPHRDPREHVITVAYYALVDTTEHSVHASTDAKKAAWFEIDDVPTLAFDHDRILKMAYDRLKGELW